MLRQNHKPSLRSIPTKLRSHLYTKCTSFVISICWWQTVVSFLLLNLIHLCSPFLYRPLISFPMQVGEEHGRMNYKDTKPYMSAFRSVDLLTDFAAFCLTDFIDWRYIHSWFVFSSQLVNCCPHGRRNYTLLVYCCPSAAPSLWPPSQCTVYTDSVWLWGGGGC